MNRPTVVTFALLAVLVIANCDVSSSRDPLDLDGIPRLGVVPELRIGSVDDPEAGFSAIGRVTVDRDGQIYVLEAMDMQIRVYTPHGDELRRIGRRGEGPGEFQRVGSIGVVGDTLWTFDQAGDRITLFARDGRLLSTARAETPMIPLWRPRCVGHLLPDRMRPDGLFTSAFSRMSCNQDNETSAVDATVPIRIPHLIFDATGTVVDTIGWDSAPNPRMARPPGSFDIEFESIDVDGRPYSVPQPPIEVPLWLQLIDGRVELFVRRPTSEDAWIELTRLTSSGDTVFARRLPYTPEPYTSDDMEALASQSATARMRGSAADPSIVRRLRAAMDFPEFRPVAQMGYVDADERIWLARYAPGNSTARFLVIDSDGLPLGEIRFPGRFQFRWSEGNAIWGVEPDELDVPWLVKYRIEP